MNAFSKSIIVLLIFISVHSTTSAQVPGGRYTDIDNLIEAMTEELEEDNELVFWIEEMQFLNENRINLNLATKEDLLRIPFLNEPIIDNILKYRNQNGNFLTIFELVSVEGISSDLAEKLSFFITFDEIGTHSAESTGWQGRSRHMLLVKGWQTFPKAAGYLPREERPPAYQGGPQKVYARYLFQKGTALQAGFTGDRDPGEQFFKGSNPHGFDFNSAHLSFRLSNLFPQVIAGDYSVRAGQGLVVWQGFSMGKTAEVLQVSKSMSHIRPYTSTDENFFFRGVATAIQTGNFRTYLFASRKKSDGNIVIDEDGRTSFTSLQTSGYHRTLSEIEDKNSVGHTVAGAILGVTYSKIRLGANLLYEQFQYPFERGNQLYQKSLFSGKENYNGSLDYRWVTGRYQLYGEAAISKSGGFAFINGLDGRLHDQFNIAMVFRHFERDYQATWANAFGENSRATNETGFYTGFTAFPASKVNFTGYADWFWSPWLNYSTTGPSNGYEFMFQTNYRLSRKTNLYARVKHKSKANKTKGDNFYYDLQGKRTNFRLHGRYFLTGQLFLTSRFETTIYDHLTEENGIMLMQDIGWKPVKPALTLHARVAWFNTDSYNSRIYAYENDLLYNFATPALFGKGFRTYLNLRYSFFNNFDAWAKIGQTVYSDLDSISSGYNLIAGNSKTEFKIQLRYRY